MLPEPWWYITSSQEASEQLLVAAGRREQEFEQQRRRAGAGKKPPWKVSSPQLRLVVWSFPSLMDLHYIFRLAASWGRRLLGDDRSSEQSLTCAVIALGKVVRLWSVPHLDTPQPQGIYCTGLVESSLVCCPLASNCASSPWDLSSLIYFENYVQNNSVIEPQTVLLFFFILLSP